jgi:FkbM family methyltransferase
MIEQGRAEKFRETSFMERVAVGVGSMLPRALRRPAADAFARVVERIQPGGLVAHLPHGERVHLLARHRYLAWNPDEYEAFRADIRPGDTILDIGANIGAYTVLFAHWTGASGRVVAFEPAPEPRRALQQMLEANAVAGRVTVMEEAVTAGTGTAPFHANGSDGANRVLTADRPGSISVGTTTVDAFCQRMHVSPAFMKIDVEGAELDVLRGARRTIAASPRLRVYVEMHPRLWPEFNITHADVEAELQSQGLRAERLDGDPDLWNLEGVCLRVVRCAS